MAAWIVLVALWIVGPLLLTWKYVSGQGTRFATCVVVLAYTAVVWTAIAASDSSTAGVGFVAMAPLAYAVPLAAIALTRYRERRA